MGKLSTCYGLVSNTSNKCATASWQQVVVMEFGKRHDTTDTTEFCPRQLITDLLQTCYGLVANLLRTRNRETGVMDFVLYSAPKHVKLSQSAVDINQHCVNTACYN